MDPIYEEVGEADEKRKLENVVQPEGRIGRRIVQFGVASHLSYKEWNGEDGHNGKSGGCLFDLERDLIPEVFWVGEGSMVENEVVGEGSANKVHEESKYPGDDMSIHKTSRY